MEEKEIAQPLIVLGELLRAGRQRLGYSEEDVASRLKITSRVVRALEAGDPAVLPHAVYARGFFRAYAGLVGVDEEHVLAACAELADPEEVTPAFHTVEPARSSSFHIPWLAIIICLLFLLGAGWYFREHLPLGSLSSVGKTPVQATVQPEPVRPPSLPELVSVLPATNATQPASSVLEEPTNSTTPASGATVGSVPTLPAGDSGAAAGEAPQPSDIPPLPADGSHQLAVVVNEDCWVRIVADGKEVEQRVLKKGETLAWTFKEKMSARLGNPTGVRIVYDGKDYDPNVRPGRTLTLSLPQDIQN